MSSTVAGNEVISGLRQVVAETYALIGQTHICHWNVRGPGFFALHTAFEEQYNELFMAVDVVAERIRALGSLAPGGLGNLSKMAGFSEIAEEAEAEEMVQSLYDQHLKVVRTLKSVRDAAGQAGDEETEDLMIARTQMHEKTAWMLKSYLG
ncbi:MAG: DNA starvation/stationary phase protection protein [Verrucomicrobiota bacterium]